MSLKRGLGVCIMWSYSMLRLKIMDWLTWIQPCINSWLLVVIWANWWPLSVLTPEHNVFAVSTTFLLAKVAFSLACGKSTASSCNKNANNNYCSTISTLSYIVAKLCNSFLCHCGQLYHNRLQIRYLLLHVKRGRSRRRYIRRGLAKNKQLRHLAREKHAQ